MDPAVVAQLTPSELTVIREDTKSTFEFLWSNHGGTKIGLLNPRYPGVRLPSHVVASHPDHLVLDYPADPKIPITDLQLTPTGISATLSFNRTPYQTFIP